MMKPSWNPWKLRKEIQRLQHENERYRKALRFYAKDFFLFENRPVRLVADPSVPEGQVCFVSADLRKKEPIPDAWEYGSLAREALIYN